MKALVIREARPGDEEVILGFLRDFAAFEKLTHTFRLTREIVARDFMGAQRRVQCDVAEWNGKPAGLAIWLRNYGTFAAAPVFLLEDIYVAPEYRRRGIATALFKHLAKRAKAENAIRIDWVVLDWNTHAIDFYSRMGAELVQDWRVCRLGADAIAALAQP